MALVETWRKEKGHSLAIAVSLFCSMALTLSSLFLQIPATGWPATLSTAAVPASRPGNGSNFLLYYSGLPLLLFHYLCNEAPEEFSSAWNTRVDLVFLADIFICVMGLLLPTSQDNFEVMNVLLWHMGRGKGGKSCSINLGTLPWENDHWVIPTACQTLSICYALDSLPVWPWVTCFTSVCLSFLVYKVGTIESLPHLLLGGWAEIWCKKRPRTGPSIYEALSVTYNYYKCEHLLLLFHFCFIKS